MAKVTVVATALYKGRDAGESFVTSAKNARALVASGAATLPNVKKVPAKKVAAKKAPAKRAYNTRALKAT